MKFSYISHICKRDDDDKYTSIFKYKTAHFVNNTRKLDPFTASTTTYHHP